MSLNIETTQGLERRVTITVPAEAVEKATREEFKRAAKNVRVDGFRKGTCQRTSLNNVLAHQSVKMY